MSDLYRLCYVSRSRIAPECHADELAAILAFAGRHNHLIGISGVLIISGGYFCQVLEGNNTAVEHVFESIQLDDRHDSITVLEFVRIGDRLFGGWDMARYDCHSDNHDAFPIRHLIQQLQVVETGRSVLDVFSQLIRRREADGLVSRPPEQRPAA